MIEGNHSSTSKGLDYLKDQKYCSLLNLEPGFRSDPTLLYLSLFYIGLVKAFRSMYMVKYMASSTGLY
jgi:hypothetical protein